MTDIEEIGILRDQLEVVTQENDNLKETIKHIQYLNQLKEKDYEKRMSDNATIIVNLHEELENERKKNADLTRELEDNKDKWKYFDTRFVKTVYKHQEEEKLAYVIFPEGEEVHYIDLEALIDSALDRAYAQTETVDEEIGRRR